MLCDDSGNMISAGILVEKDGQRRLTVSTHRWQKELDESPEKMGDPEFFRVTQGKTHVGHVSSKLWTSDIGLATLNENVEFRNRFIDIPGDLAQLLHSDMLQSNQVYMIDSFTTGRQGQLLCKGKRIIKPEDKERRVDQVLRGKQKDLLEVGRYLVLVQGIFATSEPMIYGEPITRAGDCGSAVVRLRADEESRDDGKSSLVSAASTKLHAQRVERMFVNNDEIGGFMHWSDLQEKTTRINIPRLYCYAEVTDPLTEAGWRVAKTAEKRKRSGPENPFD